jgi:hypothetical protein
MRTTIEMKPEHRARIVELAAHRGEKGFSAVVSDALDLYLETRHSRAKSIRNALALRGSLSESDASDLMTHSRKVRSQWR